MGMGNNKKFNNKIKIKMVETLLRISKRIRIRIRINKMIQVKIRIFKEQK
jgi:hypothetical protein